MPIYCVKVKPIEPLLVAMIHDKIRTYNDIKHVFREVFAHLRQTGGGARPGIDAQVAVYYETEHPKQYLKVDAAVPISNKVPRGKRVTVCELPGVKEMAFVCYQGSCDGLGRAYTILKIWLEANGYRIVGPTREYYKVGPGSGKDPASYMIKVQFPVEKI